jgi:radical SAM superfamily enzyme YgiQ (UPF0313 family)
MLDKSYAKELLKALIPLQIEWLAQSDISIAEDQELLDLCKESGCIFTLLGIESLNPENLASVDKSTVDIKRASENLKKLRKKGIPFCTSFIFGFDSDDKESFRATVNFAIKNKVHYFLPFFYMPVPNSRFDLQLKEEGRYISERRSDWASFNLITLQFKPKQLSVEDFEKEFRKSLSKFYSCRSILFRILLPPFRYRNPMNSIKYNFWHMIMNIFLKIRLIFGKYPLSAI